MFKKVLLGTGLAVLGVATLASCGGGNDVQGNEAKPLIFFNRQPSNPDTGEVDKTTMNHNDKTFYVGFDAAGGGAVQGKLITDHFAKLTKAEADRNGDGILGYVLFVGDNGHNDSKARTKGIREALGTWNGSTDPTNKKEGSIKVKDGELKVVELEAAECKNDSGATWDATTAGNFATTWEASHGKKIDAFVSNNDGMAMAVVNKSLNEDGSKYVPTFGYDANGDALEAIKEGKLTGTISQNVDAQAIGTLQLMRNLLDGLTPTEALKKGITEKDQYGNKVSAEMTYKAEDKALLALNSAITKDNVDSVGRDAGIKQTDAPKKKVLLTLYNSSDNFLSSSYKPALQHYAKLMNLELNIVEGDGNSETSCLDKFVNLDQYDAYAVNMVKTNSGADYLRKINA